MAASGGKDNQPKLLKNKVKSIIQSTDQSALELKNVLTDMNAQQKSRFSFARQRMDLHREPAKLAKVVGSSMPSYIAQDTKDSRDPYKSQNSSLNMALQAKGVFNSSGVRNRDSPESLRDVNRSRNSPEGFREVARVRSSPKDIRDIGRGRNSPDEYRQPEDQEVRQLNRSRNDHLERSRQQEDRSRNSPPEEYRHHEDRSRNIQDEYRQQEVRGPREMHHSRNNLLEQSRHRDDRSRSIPDEYRQQEVREVREANRSRNDPLERSRQQEDRSRNNPPEQYRQQEERSRNTQDEYRPQEVRGPREMHRSRNSPPQHEEAPMFGRESRDFRDDRKYENIRREKKERDNKTHESLLILRDDIDRIKGDLQRSKSSTREPRRSNEKVYNTDGSPSLSSYQGLTRDNKSPRQDPYQQAQPRRVNAAAISVSTTYERPGYSQQQQAKLLPPYDREPNKMSQSNPQYLKQQTFGQNDNQPRAMKFNQSPPQNHREEDFSHYPDRNERPKSPMTADFAGPQGRNEYERPLARSQSPINDNNSNRSQHQQLPIYQSQIIKNPQNQQPNRSQAIINKQVAQKIDNNRYISEPNHGLNYGQINVQKSRSDNFNNSQSQKFVPTQPNHPNLLLNLLTPPPGSKNNMQQQHEQFMSNTQRSKLNFSGIVSDVNGSYSFDDDNEVQPVSMNLNLEDLLNESQLHIPKRGYQQPSQAKNSNDRNKNANAYDNQQRRGQGQGQDQNQDQDHQNYYSNPNPQKGYDHRQARNQPFDRRDNAGPNALFNLSESMIAKNDAYGFTSSDRNVEPVRRSKWDVGHGNGYESARGQLQSNYQTNPVVTSGQYRKY